MIIINEDGTFTEQNANDKWEDESLEEYHKRMSEKEDCVNGTCKIQWDD